MLYPDTWRRTALAVFFIAAVVALAAAPAHAGRSCEAHKPTPQLIARGSCTRPGMSSTETGQQRASWPMPGLPGAAKTSRTRGERLAALTKACSRPPEPMTSTFMGFGSKTRDAAKSSGHRFFPCRAGPVCYPALSTLNKEPHRGHFSPG